MLWEFALHILSTKGHFIVGALIALWGVLSARQIARRKNSTDVLLCARQDEKYAQGMRTISALHESTSEDINTYALENKKDPKAIDIRYVLNHWEHISVGIQNGIYCEKILKEASGTTVTKLFDKTMIFIETVNKEKPNKPTYYQDFKWLANRWKNHEVPVKKWFHRNLRVTL